MPTSTRSRISIVVLAAVILILTGCTGSGDPIGPGASTPAAGPSVSASPLIEIDLGGFVDCLREGGIEVDPETEPRFGATAEVQVAVPTSDGISDNVGIFIYANTEASSAGKAELDSTLESVGSPPSDQFGNVLVAGLGAVIEDASASQAVSTLIGCLT